MKRLLLLFSILNLIQLFCFAQKQGQALIDSLNITLSNYKSPCIDPCLADTEKVLLMNTIAYESVNSNPDTSIILSKNALALAEELEWQFGIALSHYNLGNSFRIKGDYSNSLKELKVSLDIFKIIELNYHNSETISKIIARNLRAFGMVYREVSNHSKSLDYYFQSLKLCKETKDSTNLLFTLNNMGLVYIDLRQYDKALNTYLLPGLQIAKKTNNQLGVALILGNIGWCYQLQGKISEALKYHNEALIKDTQIGNKSGIARHYSNIGDVYKEFKDYKKAERYYSLAVDINNQIDVKRSIAVRHINVGSL